MTMLCLPVLFVGSALVGLIVVFLAADLLKFVLDSGDSLLEFDYPAPQRTHYAWQTVAEQQEYDYRHYQQFPSTKAEHGLISRMGGGKLVGGSMTRPIYLTL